MHNGHTSEEAALAAEELGWSPYRALRAIGKKARGAATGVLTVVSPIMAVPEAAMTPLMALTNPAERKRLKKHGFLYRTRKMVPQLARSTWKDLSTAGALVPVAAIGARPFPDADGSFPLRIYVTPQEISALHNLIVQRNGVNVAKADVVLGADNADVTLRGIRIRRHPQGGFVIETRVSPAEVSSLKKILAATKSPDGSQVVLGIWPFTKSQCQRRARIVVRHLPGKVKDHPFQWQIQLWCREGVRFISKGKWKWTNRMSSFARTVAEAVEKAKANVHRTQELVEVITPPGMSGSSGAFTKLGCMGIEI